MAAAAGGGVVAGYDASDGFVGVVAAESVGAEDEGGVGCGGDGGGVGEGGAIDIADGVGDDVAVGVCEGFFGGEGAGVDELLHVGVVVGELAQSVGGCVGVAAAVATPGDVGAVGCDPGQHDGGAHAEGVEVFDDVLVDGIVGILHGLVEQLGGEVVGVGGLGGGFGGEGLGQCLHGDGRGHFSGIVASHSVGHGEQCALWTEGKGGKGGVVGCPVGMAEVGTDDEGVFVVVALKPHVGGCCYVDEHGKGVGSG